MSKMQDRELWSVAAFRLRESANKILALADRAESPVMRRKLLSLCAKLTEEEQQLLEFARKEGVEVRANNLHSEPGGANLPNGGGLAVTKGRGAEKGPDRPKRTSRARPRSTPKS